jgi:hypothetical protein
MTARLRSALARAAAFLSIAAAATTGGAAQDQATTLLAAARSAELVVVARVTASTDPSPEWHRLQFSVLQTLKGNAPAALELLEPAGACCGRSLFTLVAGDVRLLFLQRRGPTWHPFGGSRGVELADGPAGAALVAHVQGLLAAGDDAARARLLAASLAHPEPRVADDAAHALAALPTLALPAADADLVAAALSHAVHQGLTRTASLADAAVRLGRPAVLDRVLTTYLDADRADHAETLRRALRRGDVESVATRLPALVHLDGGGADRRALRAAELLVELPTPTARPALDAMLQRATHPRLHLCIAEGLLAAGARAEELAARVPAPVLELARERLARPRRFRAIDPRR